MKNKKVVGAALASALALALCGGALAGCGDDNKNKPEKLTDATLQATKIADFTTGDKSDREAVFESDGWENGDVFNTWWKKDNVTYDNNIAELSISEMTEKEQGWDAENEESVDCQAEYYGGEMRTSKYYGYGDYEVRMKPAKCPGTASTFFVCTGPYDVNYETQEPNPHDEIDIEFLGKDTTKVQFNYFVNGVGGHEKMYDLGFDASQEFHTYGFRWAEDHIVWFVDGKPVYKVKASASKPLPSTPGRILTNYWTGTEKAEDWMGKYNDDYSKKVQYEHLGSSATPLDDPTKDPNPDPGPGEEIEVPETGWTDISINGFDGWGTYDVSKDNGALTISHDAALKEWQPCGMELASNYSWVKFKVKNNAETEAYVRLNIKKDSPEKDSIMAVVSEYECAKFISEAKALGLTLGAGEEADIVCKLNSEEVVVDKFVLFLNNTDLGTQTSGSITISELSGIVAENVEVPDDKPSLPEGEGWTAINWTNFKYNTPEGETNAYTATAQANSVTITHTQKPASGNNVFVSVAYGTNNLVHCKIKNNAATKTIMRVNAQQTPDYKTNIISATVNGEPIEIPTGDNWDGISFDLEANAEVVFECVVANTVVNLAFAPNNMEGGADAGDITISEICMKNDGTVTPVEPESAANTTLPEGEGWIGLDISSMTNSVKDTYVLTPGNKDDNSLNSIQISHTVATEASKYPNANMNLNYGTQNKMYFVVKNNSADTAATVKICIQDPNNGYRNTMTSAKITPVGGTASEINGLEWGAVFTLEANAEVVFECEFDPAVGKTFVVALNDDGKTATGDITVSKVAITKVVQDVGGEEEQPPQEQA